MPDDQLVNELLAVFINVFTRLYRDEFPASIPDIPTQRFLRKRAHLQMALDVFRETCAEALSDFTTHMPARFKKPFRYDTCEGGIRQTLLDALTVKRESRGTIEFAFRRPEFEHAYRALACHFERRPLYDNLGLFDFSPSNILSQHQNLDPPWIRVFERTPLYPFATDLLPADVTLPFDFPDEVRFAHQWVMAESGTGKTTLLSAQIAEDLDRVAHGECSVFIMDSQNRELTHALPRLKRFAPGGDLFGKLVYLEPDLNNPLALNIFDFQNSDYREAEHMTLTFMSGFAETSENMKNVIRYTLRALLLVPDATVMTFKELLYQRKEKGSAISGFELLANKYPQLLSLKDDVRHFLSRGMFEGQYTPSVGAVKARLDGFTSDPLFHAVFSSPRSRLDLAEKLASGSVVVVNADKDKLGEAVLPFGRYFLSRLSQASRSRLGERSRKLPVFCYIDEAQDYIKNDASITELLFQARKQNVGVCIAHQNLTQIDPQVQAALSDCAIRCSPIRRGLFRFDIREPEGRQSYDLSVPAVDFSKMPAMNSLEWELTLAQMWDAYSVEADGPVQESPQREITSSPTNHIAPPRDPDAEDRYTGPQDY